MPPTARSSPTSVAPIAPAAPALAVTPAAVTATRADTERANDGPALAGVRQLDAALAGLVGEPSAAAKEVRAASRVPTRRTEISRVGRPIVDVREGRENARPRQAGMVDDVATALYRASHAQNPCDAGTLVAGETIDPEPVDVELPAARHGPAEVEAAVTPGDHAVRSLLRGRDGTLAGPAVTDLLDAVAPELDAERRAPTDATHAAFRQVARAADDGATASGSGFAPGSPEGDVVPPSAAIAVPAAEPGTRRRLVTEPEPGCVPCTGSDGPDRPKAEFG